MQAAAPETCSSVDAIHHDLDSAWDNPPFLDHMDFSKAISNFETFFLIVTI